MDSSVIVLFAACVGGIYYTINADGTKKKLNNLFITILLSITFLILACVRIYQTNATAELFLFATGLIFIIILVAAYTYRKWDKGPEFRYVRVD